jgi:hypothetical protein
MASPKAALFQGEISTKQSQFLPYGDERTIPDLQDIPEEGT